MTPAAMHYICISAYMYATKFRKKWIEEKETLVVELILQQSDLGQNDNMR